MEVEVRLAETIDRHQATGLFTHLFAAVGELGGGQPYLTATRLGDGRDLFDLASLTKALATTPLVWRSLRRHGLDVATSIGTWLAVRPGDLLSALHASLLDLPVRSLLAHASGLPAWRNFWIGHLGPNLPVLTPSAVIDCLNRAAAVIDKNPESRRQVYSDVGFILLGLVLGQVEGRGLASQFHELCRDELGLPEDLPLLYSPGPDIQARAVTTGYCALRQRQLIGEVHDENCAALGGVAGHAGLFGTGPALLAYLSALAASKLGHELLSANAAARVLPVGAIPNEGLIGWRQGADPSSLPYAGGAAIGHLGFTGVAFWVWPERSGYAILLTNRVASGRLRPGIAALRREVFADLAAAVP